MQKEDRRFPDRILRPVATGLFRLMTEQPCWGVWKYAGEKGTQEPKCIG